MPSFATANASKILQTASTSTPEALNASLDTQISLGNLKQQPDYKMFVA